MLLSCEAGVSSGGGIRASAAGSMAPALLTGTGEEGTGEGSRTGGQDLLRNFQGGRESGRSPDG
jgi:hypothetical protein